MQTYQVGDLVRCRPGHPDQRVHEIVSVTEHAAREPQPHVFGCPVDNGAPAYTCYCAVPISAHPEDGKHMTADGFVPVDTLTEAQQSWLGAQLAVRASGCHL